MIGFANPLLIIWVVFAGVVVIILLYRFLLTWHEDTAIHFEDGTQLHSECQARVAQLVELVDFWGKRLTAGVLLYSFGIAVAYLYIAW